MLSGNFIRTTGLYKKQHDAVFCPHRWGLCEAGTKTGATTACIVWLLEKAFGADRGANFLWVAPTSALSYAAFQQMRRGLTQGSFVPRESPTPSLTIPNGAVISFKAADNPQSIESIDPSMGVSAAVVDRAAVCKEESWHNLRSALLSTEGPARIVGHVKGRSNWFYDFARRAESGEDLNAHYTKLTIFDAIDAGIITQSEVDDARKNLPEVVFRELYLAEPCDERLEQLGRSGDPRRLTDEELALYADLDPSTIMSISDTELAKLLQ
jgi:hypothetical protein